MPALEDYQINGARWLAGGGHNGVSALGDDPGLGKTAQAVHALDLAGISRALIVAPAAVKQVWPYEIKKWSEDRSRRVVSITENVQMGAWLDGKFDIAVLSYEAAVKWQKVIRDNLDILPALIIDEAHYAKSQNARRTKALYGPHAVRQSCLAGIAAHVWPLSGTFMPNDPMDIWTHLRVAGVTQMTHNAFEQEYFSIDFSTNKQAAVPKEKRLRELQEMIGELVLRRTKKLLNLPRPWIGELPIDGNDEELRTFLANTEGLSKSIYAAIENGTDLGLAFDDVQYIATMRRLTGEAKAPGFAKLLVERIKNGAGKCLVMCWHTKVVQIVAKALEENGIECVQLTGATGEPERIAAVNRFQEGTAHVFIGNIMAAGTGLTLTAAEDVYMLEISWRPADNAQAIARAHRKGQTKHINVYFVSLNRSIDLHVSKVVQDKTTRILEVDPEAY